MNYLRKIFDTSKKDVDMLLPIVTQINGFEAEISALDDDALRAKGHYFKEQFQAGQTLDQLLPEVFAVVREVSSRTLGMRHFDVQHVVRVDRHGDTCIRDRLNAVRARDKLPLPAVDRVGIAEEHTVRGFNGDRIQETRSQAVRVRTV